MEEVVGCHGHSNKENVIPPFSARAKLINPVPGNRSSSKKCDKKMRLRRKPLADITNLYIYSDNNSVQSSLAHLPSPTLSFSVSASNSKKRKSIREGNSTVQATKSNSKSLRMGFR
ncbi:hypothetical protein Pyn_03987 [Prunus yedoensis var. nudiflora]|uniref:Uncharacterized protein n=1 Tax=Prunus yedoensis var. nudiflora TaxID=2094558 RepID=A0A314V013_PRUYE|nr:hypothetical protein Pyn_03987 [Prunus yedoensis var. nudiflora]